MAATAVDVANMALKRIGVTKKVTSVTADLTGEGQAVAAFFTEARDQVLSEAWWPFAKKWARLARVNAAEAAYVAGTTYAAGAYVTYESTSYISLAGANTGHTPGAVGSEAWWATMHDSYAYVYALPTDCVAPRYLYSGQRVPSEDQKVPFELESLKVGDGTVLVTDLEDASLVYTKRVETVTLWPANFTSAMAWRLASELVYPLAKKAEIAEMAFKRSEYETARAIAQQANSQQEDADPETPSVAARSSS